MASVGLVGGLGPESTVDYYRRILAAWQDEAPGTAPSLLIDSLDVQRALRLLADDHEEMTRYLLASVTRLAAAGVSFVAITANTPHIVFDALAAASPVPLLSIVEVCMREADQRGLRRLALLGTRFTMEAPFYPAVASRLGITVVTPEADERLWLHDRYVNQLLPGQFLDETRGEVMALIRRLRDEERVDGVILGGTELPLLLRAPDLDGLPLLDTTALHVRAIVRRLHDLASSATFPGMEN